MPKKTAKKKTAAKDHKKAPKKNGRPPKTWTAEQLDKIENLAAANCTQTEIADYLDCCQKSVSNRLKENPGIEDVEFLLAYKKGHMQFIVDLRQAQASIMRGAKAPKSQVGMCIWLGKQELKQGERPIQIEATNRNINYDVSGMTDTELKTLDALLIKLQGKDKQ